MREAGKDRDRRGSASGGITSRQVILGYMHCILGGYIMGGALLIGIHGLDPVAVLVASCAAGALTTLVCLFLLVCLLRLFCFDIEFPYFVCSTLISLFPFLCWTVWTV